MSAAKRFAEEVSEVLGYQGELSEPVFEVAIKVLARVTDAHKPHVSSNPKFRELVESCKAPPPVQEDDDDDDHGPSYGEAMQRMNEL